MCRSLCEYARSARPIPAAPSETGSKSRNARERFPRAAASNSDFDAIVDTVIAALQGAALSGIVQDEAESARRSLAWLERLVRAELEG